jgi:hypothetical protein
MTTGLTQPPAVPFGNCCAGTLGVPSDKVNSLAQESTPEGIMRILSSGVSTSSVPTEALGNCCPGTFSTPGTAGS